MASAGSQTIPCSDTRPPRLLSLLCRVSLCVFYPHVSAVPRQAPTSLLDAERGTWVINANRPPVLRLRQLPESHPAAFQAQPAMCRSSAPFPSTCRVCSRGGEAAPAEPGAETPWTSAATTIRASFSGPLEWCLVPSRAPHRLFAGWGLSLQSCDSCFYYIGLTILLGRELVGFGMAEAGLDARCSHTALHSARTGRGQDFPREKQLVIHPTSFQRIQRRPSIAFPSPGSFSL